jgi:hypothetical protein
MKRYALWMLGSEQRRENFIGSNRFLESAGIVVETNLPYLVRRYLRGLNAIGLVAGSTILALCVVGQSSTTIAARRTHAQTTHTHTSCWSEERLLHTPCCCTHITHLKD